MNSEITMMTTTFKCGGRDENILPISELALKIHLYLHIQAD